MGKGIRSLRRRGRGSGGRSDAKKWNRVMTMAATGDCDPG